MMKNYIIVAGLNGAGKTTLFETEHDWFLDTREHRINADEETLALGGDVSTPEAQKAGTNVALTKAHDFIQARFSFHQEMTFAGKADIARIQAVRDQGYRITLLYVAISSLEAAKERVQQRVNLGGHYTQAADIEHRYQRSLGNLPKVAAMVDEIHIFDNSTPTGFREIYWRNETKVLRNELKRYPWLPNL
ncbi:MAG: zeta toxin family protein [Lactobacillaceae bacterium]|jgi:predicted ABC-type ATPase|nr:zeta toxin family protein [Lactobacillaceae bacterium]